MKASWKNAHPYHLWTVMLGMYGTMTVMPMIVLDCSHRTLCRYLDTISDTRHTNDWDTVTVVRTHLIITFPLLIKVRVGDGLNFLSSDEAKVVAIPFHHTIKLGLRSNKRALDFWLHQLVYSPPPYSIYIWAIIQGFTEFFHSYKKPILGHFVSSILFGGKNP